MYLCISPPYFFCSSVGFGKWHTSSASKSTEIARSVPRHHRPDTHSSSHLYCNAALQKGSSKHILTKRNKWLICDGWITKTCTKKDAVTWVAFGEKGATGPEDWTAAPFSPPGLLLLPCINTRCPPKKPAIQMEPHVQWLSYDLVPRLAHHHHISSTTTWRGPGTAPHAPIVIHWIHHQQRRRAAARTDRHSPTPNLQTQSQLIRFKKGQTVWHILQKPSIFF